MQNYDFFISRIKESIQPSTGCTEPVAIALNCATARKNILGEIKKIYVKLDLGLFKNAMGVGIPGSKKRGIKQCIALGIVGGDADSAMNVLQKVGPQHDELADELIPKIDISVKENTTSLYIETIIETEDDAVRVITYKNHDNIVSIEHTPFSDFYIENEGESDTIRMYTLEDMKNFADNVELDRILFLKEGVEMNRDVSKEGQGMTFGKSMDAIAKMNGVDGSIPFYIQKVTSCASYARMSGIQLPVMIATGSGNQGITLFLTVDAAAEKLGVSEEKEIRALALAHVVNIYAKSYIGTLSPLCACSIASGLGACVGIVYLMDGTIQNMFGAIKNTLGSITGMICDGAKEGCANKVAISSSAAYLSAMLAVSGAEISPNDGILSESLADIFKNMELLAKNGMKDTNKTIVDIMKTK